MREDYGQFGHDGPQTKVSIWSDAEQGGLTVRYFPVLKRCDVLEKRCTAALKGLHGQFADERLVLVVDACAAKGCWT
jgi:hypothetical protein